jgi:uncharacterized membrane protein
MTDNPVNLDQKKILRLYAAFGAALVLSVIPFFLAAFLSMGLAMGVLLAAYILRTDTAEGTLIENHMTFVIRTMWIGSFLALITMAAGSFYLFHGIDNTPLDPCIQHLHLLNSGAQIFDVGVIFGTFQGCLKNYWIINFKVFLISGIIAGGPVLAYFIIRYARGLARAIDGYRVSNPHHWL